ncbi:MAG: M1 family aminopeptidase, partial [Alphaproteobacteria bacterium]|nr:M1 family aminopeptidase [Alphaproteobacteria bacterium]
AFDGHGGTYRLTIEVPHGQVAVATAALESEARTDSGYSATFVGNEPPIVFVGPFSITERWHEGLRLRTYFPPDMVPLAEPYLDRVAAYIDGFGARVGPYPYSHFWVVAAPFPVGLGFPGATYVSARILPMPFMQGRSLAHEVLHNWWGNGVRVAYAAGNWSEGLTTYLADYGLAEEAGEMAAHEMRLAWLRDVTALDDSDDTALTAFVQRHHAAAQVLGYDKVAMVLHMLRQDIGDNAFDESLRAFWQQWHGRTAAWTDLQRAFESGTERNLESFFRQWLTRTGAPNLVLENAAVSEHAEGWRLSLRLRQEARPWNLTVPVVISLAEGNVVKFAEVSETTDDHVWILPSRPLAVAIDPDHHVLRRLAPGEAPPIFRDVSLDPKAAL